MLTRRQAFAPFLQRRAFDIIQPDVTKCGGLSEFKKISQMAQDCNVQVVPHGWNTAVGLAADLQISAFLPNARYVEYLTPCAYIEDLTAKPFQLDSDGCLSIPDAQGLGFDVSEEGLKRFCPQPIEFS